MYSDEKSNFEELLDRDDCLSSSSKYQISTNWNMFKVFKGISSQIAKDIFQFKDAVPYLLR